MKYLIMFIGLGFLIGGCEIQKDGYDTSNPILVKAYSESYFYPDGFYYETIDGGSIYYVNTLSIKPLDQRTNTWKELATDDIDEARYWSDLTNSYSSVSRNLISERETEKYFEFKRVNPGNMKDIVLVRAHKKNYFIPMFDKFRTIDTVGMIPSPALSTVNKKQLIEYLWSAGVTGPPCKVIESAVQDTISGIKHTIISILMVYGDFGINDIIYQYENTFIINNVTGIITMRRRLLEEFTGKRR